MLPPPKLATFSPVSRAMAAVCCCISGTRWTTIIPTRPGLARAIQANSIDVINVFPEPVGRTMIVCSSIALMNAKSWCGSGTLWVNSWSQRNCSKLTECCSRELNLEGLAGKFTSGEVLATATGSESRDGMAMSAP